MRGTAAGAQRSAAKITIEPASGPGANTHPFSDAYNVRIDYESRAHVPVMQIKAWCCLSSELVYDRVTNKEHIKAVIRICGQNEPLMVVSQLQSLLSVSDGLVGKKLYLNCRKLKEKIT